MLDRSKKAANSQFSRLEEMKRRFAALNPSRSTSVTHVRIFCLYMLQSPARGIFMIQVLKLVVELDVKCNMLFFVYIFCDNKGFNLVSLCKLIRS